jgi:peptide/nickel transport system ATP-binding protein
LLRLYRPQSGKIIFEGRDLAGLSERELSVARLRIQMIFQDSNSSLNPRQRLVDILSAPYMAHGIAEGRSANRLAIDLSGSA